MTGQENTILVFDVGNTTTVVCIAHGSPFTIGPLWRISTQLERLSDEWRSVLAPLLPESVSRSQSIEGAVIASVVPRVTRTLVAMVRDWLGLELLVVDASTDLGLTVTVDRPLEVGADRLANAVAACHLAGSPVIVVDAGTATKVDVVAEGRRFVGGAIAPGIGIGLDALAARGARLYAVEIAPPPCAIGRNTVEAVQSGLVLGHVSMIEGMVARVRAELNVEAPVIVTGGYSSLLADEMKTDVRLEPTLTLLGASLVWVRERERGSRLSGV